MDSFSAMQTLVRVVDAGSFSDAARQLGVGQPSVSKVVRRLETRLGVKLLARTTRGLSVTEAGKRYYELARRALEAADDAEIAAREAASGLTGRLCVSAAVTFGRLQIVPRLPAFLAANPELMIDLVLDDRATDLIGEGVDVALRVGPRVDSAFNGRRIGTARRFALASPDYVARWGAPERPSDLARHEALALLQPGVASSWTFARGNERESVAISGRLRMTAHEGVREAVLAGLGVAIGSEWGYGREIADGRVQILLRDWSLDRSELWAILPAGRRASAKARAFVEFVERQLRRPAD
jgi:DNA-binding transcriptional LysR family regulator